MIEGIQQKKVLYPTFLTTFLAFASDFNLQFNDILYFCDFILPYIDDIYLQAKQCRTVKIYNVNNKYIIKFGNYYEHWYMCTQQINVLNDMGFIPTYISLNQKYGSIILQPYVPRLISNEQIDLWNQHFQNKKTNLDISIYNIGYYNNQAVMFDW